MKKNITQVLVTEHRLILRMIDLLERNSSEMLDGNFSDYQFFLDAVDFIRNYADRFHHAKEEDVLFEALIANGMPSEQSPVAAMLMEHDAGRAHVALLEKGVKTAMAGETGQESVIAEHAAGYATLLREHISKEDEVLYPLAERLIPESDRDEIISGYSASEKIRGVAFVTQYEEMVMKYERLLQKS